MSEDFGSDDSVMDADYDPEVSDMDRPLNVQGMNPEDTADEEYSDDEDAETEEMEFELVGVNNILFGKGDFFRILAKVKNTAIEKPFNHKKLESTYENLNPSHRFTL